MFDYVEKRKIVTTTISHVVKLSGVEFDLEGLFDLLCGIMGSDVFSNPVLLHISDEQKKALEDAEIIVTSARGGSGEGAKFKEMLDELEMMYDKYIE